MAPTLSIEYSFYFILFLSAALKQDSGLPWWLSGKESTRQCRGIQPLGRDDPLGEEMATHSSILAWRIPGTEEPGGLPSTGQQRIRPD